MNFRFVFTSSMKYITLLYRQCIESVNFFEWYYGLRFKRSPRILMCSEWECWKVVRSYGHCTYWWTSSLMNSGSICAGWERCNWEHDLEKYISLLPLVSSLSDFWLPSDKQNFVCHSPLSYCFCLGDSWRWQKTMSQFINISSFKLSVLGIVLPQQKRD